MTFIFNFKTYKESSGLNAINLARSAFNVSETLSSQHKIIICPQIIDIEKVLDTVVQTNKFEIWSQHVDYQNGDKNTGFITTDTLKSLGVRGTLLNHAEHKIQDIDIPKYENIINTFPSCFCIPDIFYLSLLSQKYPKFIPTFIAFEPPSLIGGNISVSDTHSEDISEIIERFSNQNILVGAGIKTNKDIKICYKLGAKGVILASGFVLSQDKEKFIYDLVK